MPSQGSVGLVCSLCLGLGDAPVVKTQEGSTVVNLFHQGISGKEPGLDPSLSRSPSPLQHFPLRCPLPAFPPWELWPQEMPDGNKCGRKGKSCTLVSQRDCARQELGRGVGKQLWCVHEMEGISMIDPRVTLGTLANCCNQLMSWSPLSEAQTAPCSSWQEQGMNWSEQLPEGQNFAYQAQGWR